MRQMGNGRAAPGIGKVWVLDWAVAVRLREDGPVRLPLAHTSGGWWARPAWPDHDEATAGLRGPGYAVHRVPQALSVASGASLGCQGG